ncbi:hypothetical protein CALCODRAFT_171500 [Calocera cornea HHB12733]|uniref:Uncharacterized protein n=1 Tax=Calocera cornea HHB12733 TaxID=1353952 RepID=A0A165HTK2_9BASI|nr:hypothetical protein CALCODRAFT_171500 [Calocera cornea HHB12733]
MGAGSARGIVPILPICRPKDLLLKVYSRAFCWSHTRRPFEVCHATVTCSCFLLLGLRRAPRRRAKLTERLDVEPSTGLQAECAACALFSLPNGPSAAAARCQKDHGDPVLFVRTQLTAHGRPSQRPPTSWSPAPSRSTPSVPEINLAAREHRPLLFCRSSMVQHRTIVPFTQNAVEFTHHSTTFSSRDRTFRPERPRLLSASRPASLSTACVVLQHSGRPASHQEVEVDSSVM